MASASRDLKAHVTDVVTCPICHELLDSPKSLPCLHTFCLKCIEGHCRDNTAGDEVTCPVCRLEFEIPRDGVDGLVSNFFMANLLEARKAASDVVVTLLPCEVCFDNSDQEGSVAASTMYCVDCNQKLCERCSRPHRKWSGGPHRVLPMWNGNEMDMIQAVCDKCDKHKNDDAKVRCLDCKLNVCVSCFTAEHQQHKCYYVGTVAARCAEQIDADMELVKERAARARSEMSRLEEDRRKFVAAVEEVGVKILMKGEELKQPIDKQVNELMAEVQSLKTQKCKEIDSHKVNIEAKLVAFETFSAYCSELKSKGNACDITRAANDLHTRASELLQNDVTLTDYCEPAVTFKPTNIHEQQLTGRENLVGVVNPIEMAVGRVVHTLPEAQTVWGVTSLDDKLYVIRRLQNVDRNQIEVYNTTTTTTATTTLYSLLCRLSVPGLKRFTDMTSCKHYHCLYINDPDGKCVHRVELNGAYVTQSQWSVNYEPNCLSVTSQFTVIVTCCNDNKLLELTTHGQQLREITLQPDIVNPWHAIQLSNGQFVVCHGNFSFLNPVNRVCIVDTNGHVTQSYGGPTGSAAAGGQLRGPYHLAVDQDGFIFVLEWDNRRVLLLSPTLIFLREIVSSDQFKWNPQRLCLDVHRRRLYVGENKRKDAEWKMGRVVVVQLIAS